MYYIQRITYLHRMYFKIIITYKFKMYLYYKITFWKDNGLRISNNLIGKNEFLLDNNLKPKKCIISSE